MSNPLDGVTVVSLEQAVAAPFATRQLAELGARVIKVERPGAGDFARHYDEAVHGLSSHFVWLNRSKESLTLDLKSAAGREILAGLLGRADVFVQNLAPGAVGRLGVEVPAGVVACHISGFGADGPWADRKAYDLLVQAESGLMSLTGTPADRVKVGISVADIAAGMYAYSGVLAALLQKARAGEAPTVRVSLFEALAEWMGFPAYYTEYGGAPPRRAGGEHATIAPYGPYPTGDGGTILVAVQNDREWVRLCADVLGDPALATDPRFVRNSDRVAHREELHPLIAAALARLDDPEQSLTGAGIANARLRDMADFLDHPVLRGRGRWREVGTPGGPVRALLPPADLSGVEPRMGPVPAVGAHTDAILAELGYSAAGIARLRADGVV